MMRCTTVALLLAALLAPAPLALGQEPLEPAANPFRPEPRRRPRPAAAEPTAPAEPAAAEEAAPEAEPEA